MAAIVAGRWDVVDGSRVQDPKLVANFDSESRSDRRQSGSNRSLRMVGVFGNGHLGGGAVSAEASFGGRIGGNFFYFNVDLAESFGA